MLLKKQTNDVVDVVESTYRSPSPNPVGVRVQWVRVQVQVRVLKIRTRVRLEYTAGLEYITAY